MSQQFNEEATEVPISVQRSVSVEPGQPWPSAYRGSRYSLVNEDDFGDDAVLKWENRDLSIFADAIPGLRQAMERVGKRGGLGSFRITAQREVITKVEADRYAHLDQAPMSEGWVPVYLGTVSGTIDFGSVDTDPDPPQSGIKVWTGLPFNHGERWSVSHDGKLVWNWRDYRFESAFDHSELIEKYAAYRPNPGRVYITEHGHVWGNVPFNDVLSGKEQEVQQTIAAWREEAESSGDTSSLRLVNRRLVATSQSDDPAEGHLPIHLGYLGSFDDGTIPRPIVDDETYFAEVCEYEQAWG